MNMKKNYKFAVDMTYHYTYRITNKIEGMHYYGARSCDCLPKEDIGIKYFSSSRKNSSNIRNRILKNISTRY